MPEFMKTLRPLGGGPFHDPAEVLDDGLPTPRPERTQLSVIGRGGPVPSMICRHDIEPGRGEGTGQRGVAQGVLAQAMSDDDDTSHRLLCRPAVRDEPGTVECLDGEGRGVHRRHC